VEKVHSIAAGMDAGVSRGDFGKVDSPYRQFDFVVEVPVRKLLLEIFADLACSPFAASTLPAPQQHQ
jgi:hypothetical protein